MTAKEAFSHHLGSGWGIVYACSLGLSIMADFAFITLFGAPFPAFTAWWACLSVITVLPSFLLRDRFPIWAAVLWVILLYFGAIVLKVLAGGGGIFGTGGTNAGMLQVVAALILSWRLVRRKAVA